MMYLVKQRITITSLKICKKKNCNEHKQLAVNSELNQNNWFSERAEIPINNRITFSAVLLSMCII